MARRLTKATSERIKAELRASASQPPRVVETKFVTLKCGHAVKVEASADTGWLEEHGSCEQCRWATATAR
ncbi:MAG: hypothetical protein ABI972_23270 [Acidobacteriota bacterium]